VENLEEMVRSSKDFFGGRIGPGFFEDFFKFFWYNFFVIFLGIWVNVNGTPYF